ncbi:hypothetical protein [Moheibacter sediminis]|uniref:Uncharacterized protein n=1 Tax=Moheibacter sediminis TaxID=1434700 RepID=A0A1W1ZSJ5_9FLAO|nr:hypothetical protein [Moheibacter sediminis]SMC51202.1 hypothetical protein SAMN06296427_103190 [Moheibacter sediminis]
MKKTFTILLFAASLALSAQISTTRMNDLKLGMSLSEVESSLGKPLELTKGENDYGYVTKISHKGAEFSVRFIENQNESGMTYYSLYEVETVSSAVKTISKIGIGSSLDDLWKAYKNYSISVWKGWDENTEKYSTTERVFQLQDNDAATVLYFYLRNDKVYKISLNYFEGC